jgi:hypothetical protein
MTVARELAKYKLDLVGVQEVRWDKEGKTEMGGAYGTYGGGERCIPDFGGETRGKATTWETQA